MGLVPVPGVVLRGSGLTPGASYQVRLYFDDWYWSKVGQRVFDVAIDDTVVLKDFDIIKAAADAVATENGWGWRRTSR